MPRLTILIPFLRHSKIHHLEETLLSVLENRPEETEILVLNGNGYGDPYQLAEEGVVFLEVSGDLPIVECINRGIEAARAPIVQVMVAGVEVIEGWSESALSHFDDPEVAIVSPMVYDRRAKKRSPQVQAVQVAYRCGGHLKLHGPESPVGKWVRLAPHAASPFVRRSALQEAGLLNVHFGLQLAYVDLTLVLHVLGWRTAMATGSKVFSRRGLLPAPPPFHWARQNEQLFWRWADWGGWTRSLHRHFWGNFLELWSLFPRWRMWQHLAGRFAGLGHYGAHRLCHEQQKLRMDHIEAHAPSPRATLPFDFETDSDSPRSKAA